jgi:hypothetical protein
MMRRRCPALKMAGFGLRRLVGFGGGSSSRPLLGLLSGSANDWMKNWLCMARVKGRGLHRALEGVDERVDVKWSR